LSGCLTLISTLIKSRERVALTTFPFHSTKIFLNSNFLEKSI
jgi:hypothetical protein